MAHNLGISRHRMYNLMWRWSLMVIVVFGIQSGVVSKEDRLSLMGSIPEACAHLISGVNVNSSWEAPSLAEKGNSWSRLSESQTEIVQALYWNSGTFTGRQGPFNASEYDQSQEAQIFPRRMISETRYDQVYSIDLFLILTFVSSDSPQLQLNAEIQGVFSNLTGGFCATFCAGRSPEERKRKNPKDSLFARHFLRDETLITPAEFAYRAKHPESKNVPSVLQQKDCDIHIEVVFPKAATMVSPFARGAMTSLRSSDDPLYFHPLNISGISPAPYLYNETVQGEARILGPRAISDVSNDIEVWSKHPPLCDRLAYEHLYPPVWNSSCSSSESELCSPFQNLNISRFTHSLIKMQDVHCTPDWKIRATFEFVFTQNGNGSHASHHLFLFAEGYWNFYKPGQLVMLAYYFDNDGSPVDTRIQITLQIPMVQTLHHRYSIVGHVRSARQESDPLHFLSFSFVGDIVSFDDSMYRSESKSGVTSSRAVNTDQFSYHYDKTIRSTIEPVCSAHSGYKKFNRNARFPDGSTTSDLEVSLYRTETIKDQTFERKELLLQNVAIGQKFRWMGDDSDELPTSSTPTRRKRNRESSTADPKHILLSFRDIDTIDGSQVAMEGYYDSTTGFMCMLGCRTPWKDVPALYEDGVADRKPLNESCDLLYSIQYPPTNPELWAKRPFVTGVISSLRDAGHPLYFEPLVFNSTVPTNYSVHSRRTMLRRNMETVISLVTLSLTTFFVGIQVGYSTRQSNFRNLRFVSFVMLAILISGHFLLLVLGFKTFWTNSLPVDTSMSFSAFSKWPEVHEVILRGTSMVALLLELRLMQLVYRSRTQANSTPQMVTDNVPPKVSEVSVLRACLPAYVALMSVVACVHWQLGPHQDKRHYWSSETMWNAVWADLQAFSGVIVDLFLFPQVVANVLWDTEKNIAPLYPLFYVGLTTVRSAAHLFDVARAWNFISEEDQFYFYANPDWDLYSTPWDIVIPCCSVGLAMLLFFQQRYGGCCFIPRRSRRQSYQRVGSFHADI